MLTGDQHTIRNVDLKVDQMFTTYQSVYHILKPISQQINI